MFVYVDTREHHAGTVGLNQWRVVILVHLLDGDVETLLFVCRFVLR